MGRYEGNPYELTDWQIMVNIIQGRDFAGLDINPYVTVSIGNQKYKTNVHKASNSPYYGEVNSFFFRKILFSLYKIL